MDDFKPIKARIRGPVVGLLTPFAPDGSVDFDSLPGYIEHQIGAGFDVLAFLPMISSLCVLTAEEKLRIAAETKRIAGDRALVHHQEPDSRKRYGRWLDGALALALLNCATSTESLPRN